MTKMQEPNRNLWLWLFQQGGRYSVVEIARHFDWHIDYATQQIYSMLRQKRVQKFSQRINGRLRVMFGVTGMCEVPTGFTLAEVQL